MPKGKPFILVRASINFCAYWDVRAMAKSGQHRVAYGITKSRSSLFAQT